MRERPIAILPGQYFDAETGLHQNWNRDYDPTIGRYLQSDPLGLKAGVGTYVYVDNRPLVAIDPDGLMAAVGGFWKCRQCGEWIGQLTDALKFCSDLRDRFCRGETERELRFMNHFEAPTLSGATWNCAYRIVGEETVAKMFKTCQQCGWSTPYSPPSRRPRL